MNMAKFNIVWATRNIFGQVNAILSIDRGDNLKLFVLHRRK